MTSLSFVISVSLHLIIAILIISFVVSAIIKRINASKRIEELMAFANGLRNLIVQTTEGKKKKAYEKQLKKIENKIANLRLLTTPKKNYSQTDNLRYKLKVTRYLLILSAIIAVITAFLALDFYDDLVYYREDVSSLYDQVYDLQEENTDLEYKAEYLDWYTDNTRLVIADEGPLHNTYHKFGCEKVFDAKGVQIFIDATVTNNPKYTKCPDCNKE